MAASGRPAEVSSATRPPVKRMGKFAACPLLLFSFFFVFFATLFSSSSSEDTMDRMGSVRDGQTTLVSAGGSFELGFFSPGGSTKKYLCVRFNKGQEKPIVWVANRERPLNDSTGVLKFGGDGNLVALNKHGDIIWSTEMASNTGGNRVAQLLDTGNLVVRDAGGGDDPPGGSLWQSFDEPGDTLLPGMKLLVNTKTGATQQLTSWKSAEDPSPGKYSYRLEVNKLPRLVLREGSTVKMSAGVWNGVRFTGAPGFNDNGVFNTSVVSSGDEVYYTDRMIGNSSLLRVVLNASGMIQRLVWSEDTGLWNTLWSAPDVCERFAMCGAFGACTDGTFPFCRCLTGFLPKSPQEWSLGNQTDGCVRKTRPDCGSADDVFLPLQQLKLPELLKNSTVSMDMSLEECRDRCAKDCSCSAYASADVREGGSGCITWSGDLINIRSYGNNGEVLYLRVSASDLDPAGKFRKKKRKKVAIVASVSVVAGIVLLVLFGFWMMEKKRKKVNTGRRHHHDESADAKDNEVPSFDFETITSATNNFSFGNKIGEGGFGIVYKGTLEDGQEIAVKRLSWSSIQGLSEFTNEVKLIAKLQHKNLVRLLGCCIQGDERMLIYEYMENKSLDFFIFDEIKRGVLGWRMRLDIILGIARGLLYLHHDSRFKIIHRDLKAGNILLDDAMNPKISDFGTARIFGADQLTEKTKRVIGTYGYMSPEYAINGIISVKSDVFSFGVLILEVLSGVKSRGIYETEPYINLLSHVWKLWQEGNGLQLLDPMVTSMCLESELLRCIQVGLLCVQEHAGDRPTMLAVVMMLASENVPLPQPKRPGFLVFRSACSTTASSASKREFGTNEMTITNITGR